MSDEPPKSVEVLPPSHDASGVVEVYPAPPEVLRKLPSKNLGALLKHQERIDPELFGTSEADDGTEPPSDSAP